MVPVNLEILVQNLLFYPKISRLGSLTEGDVANLILVGKTRLLFFQEPIEIGQLPNSTTTDLYLTPHLALSAKYLIKPDILQNTRDKGPDVV